MPIHRRIDPTMAKPARQPLRVLSKAGRNGTVATPLPGQPGVPDLHEQNAAATRSHELSPLRVPSTCDIPWEQRHVPLQVETCPRVRTDFRRYDTQPYDAHIPPARGGR